MGHAFLLMLRSRLKLRQGEVARTADRQLVLFDLHLRVNQRSKHILFCRSHGLHLITTQDQCNLEPSLSVGRDLLMEKLVMFQVVITEVVFHLLPDGADICWCRLEPLGLRFTGSLSGLNSHLNFRSLSNSDLGLFGRRLGRGLWLLPFRRI